MGGATEESVKLPGIRKEGVLKNSHRGATLENSEYLSAKDMLQPVELEALKRAFKWLDSKKDDKICWVEISDALVKLGHKTSREQIELWIWEVDDDLDDMISMEEFLTMYQRCISDSSGNEPRNLFVLVQFLMYDRDFTGRISVEQTLQILFVRHGRGELDAEIKEIFLDQQKGPDGQELKITFSQFQQRANARLNRLRWQRKEVSKAQASSKKR